MGLATEYFDDGSSFFIIDSLSINPESLTDFSLFERYPHEKTQYRFRYVKNNLEFIFKHEDIEVGKKTQTLVNLSTEMIKEFFTRCSSFTAKFSFIKVFFAMSFFCSAFFCFTSFVLSKDMGKIELGAFDYPPFYSEENGEIQGIAVELINELFGRMNIETKLTMYPLKRVLGYMMDGKTDGVMILVKTAEREKYLYYTDPIMIVRGLIWSAADREDGAVEFNNLEDLKPYKIGITLGYSYGQEFDNILKIMKVDKAPKDYNNYKKLLAHRIDIFPGNEIVAKGLFKKYPDFQGKFVHSDKSFMEWVLRMGISKKSRFVSMIPNINKILADLKNEDFIDKIVKKYTK